MLNDCVGNIQTQFDEQIHTNIEEEDLILDEPFDRQIISHLPNHLESIQENTFPLNDFDRLDDYFSNNDEYDRFSLTEEEGIKEVEEEEERKSEIIEFQS